WGRACPGRSPWKTPLWPQSGWPDNASRDWGRADGGAGTRRTPDRPGCAGRTSNPGARRRRAGGLPAQCRCRCPRWRRKKAGPCGLTPLENRAALGQEGPHPFLVVFAAAEFTHEVALEIQLLGKRVVQALIERVLGGRQALGGRGGEMHGQ